MPLPAIIFLVTFTAGCLMALLRRPVFGLVTYVGTFYVHPPSRWWGHALLMDLRWSFIAAGVTLVAIAVRHPDPPVKPFMKHGFVVTFILFYIYILLQFAWALDLPEHEMLAEYYFKYLIVLFLMYRCLDSVENLRLFLWSHVIGCFYFGWIAYTEFTGGRFEGFGGPGLSEANVAAMTLVTGALIAGSLFLATDQRRRVALLGMMPFIFNGIVTTISRSAFLAAAAAGLVFNVLSPSAWRGRVIVLSVLACVAFLMLTNENYWNRIDTVKYKGADVEGVDMGGGRLAVMEAQLRISKAYPFGCGHSCTEFLSPTYIATDKLNVGSGTRASHNSFLSLLVDQGFIGAFIYVAMVVWLLLTNLTIRAHTKRVKSALEPLLPGVAATFAAIIVGDMFVPYVRYEIRFWFFGVLLVMLNLADKERLAAHPVAQA